MSQGVALLLILLRPLLLHHLSALSDSHQNLLTILVKLELVDYNLRGM